MSPSRPSPFFLPVTWLCVDGFNFRRGLINTFDSVLFCFDSGGLFCFGGCFGKTVYKLIFVVLVFKAKKINLLVTALHPLDRVVPIYEDTAA